MEEGKGKRGGHAGSESSRGKMVSVVARRELHGDAAWTQVGAREGEQNGWKGGDRRGEWKAWREERERAVGRGLGGGWALDVWALAKHVPRVTCTDSQKTGYLRWNRLCSR